MNKLEILLQLCRKERILVQYVHLYNKNRKLLGLYILGPVCCTILLDISLKNNYCKHVCVLAEELGHHFLGVRSNLFLIKTSTFNKRVIYRQDENRALRWATDYLITDKELSYAVSELELRSCFELAEHFVVTQEFMCIKLGFLRSCFEKMGIYSNIR